MKGAALSSARRVVVLAGPTAVGKSALALRLCELLSGELVSVDSVQVYRGLQIGANKPSPAEVARVRHHLVDIRDPAEEYTAGAFYVDALRAVQDILERGRVPVLVGGTSMYLRWLAAGRPDAPKADPAVAEAVRQLLAPLEAAGDWPAGLAHLCALDAERASQLSRNDWYRLSRALCVARQTQPGAPAASLGSAAPDDVDGLDAFRESLDLRCFFLAAPREPLCRRIDARCEAMLAGGLLEEVGAQLGEGRLLPSSPAGRAIGYRQALQYLTRAPWQRADAATYRAFVESFAQASRRYSQQQTKWFRSEPSFLWVPSDWARPEAAEAAVLDGLRCERADFDARLGAPAQAELRAVKKADGQAMRVYLPALPTVDDDEARSAMVGRADACRAELEPRLPELLLQDEALAKRFPWHRRDGDAAPAAAVAAGDAPAASKRAIDEVDA